nr:MAG TPA: hypothetical protein [Caudoviricetes sp.]
MCKASISSSLSKGKLQGGHLLSFLYYNSTFVECQ